MGGRWVGWVVFFLVVFLENDVPMDEISNTWVLSWKTWRCHTNWREKSWVSVLRKDLRRFLYPQIHQTTKSAHISHTSNSSKTSSAHCKEGAYHRGLGWGCGPTGKHEQHHSIVGNSGWSWGVTVSWKFIWQVSVFQVVPNFPKTGKPFFNLSWWRKNKPHWVEVRIDALDGLHHHRKRQAVAVVVVVAVIVSKQFMLNLSQWVESSFHSSFFRWFPFPFPIPPKYLPGSLN